MAANDDMVAEQKITNALLEDILAKVTQILNIIAAAPQENRPPQYTGPTDFPNLKVGQAVQLQGTDPDGDVITWTLDPTCADKVSLTQNGLLTANVAFGAPGAPVQITVYLDDGKP